MKYSLIIIYFLSIFSISAQEKFNVFDVARSGTIEQAKILLKTNPSCFNTTNKEGYSPLTLACYRNNLQVVKLLIQNGADVNVNSTMGTPLMAAVVKGNFEIVKILLKNKAQVNQPDNNGTIPIMYAAMFKNYDICKLLIKQDANPDTKDNQNKSALDYAILADDDQLVKILKTK